MHIGAIVDLETYRVWLIKLVGVKNAILSPILGVLMVGGLVTCLVSTMSGCVPEVKAGFDSPAPSKRIDAIVDASALEDDESLYKLVEKLRSSSPSERMFAISSLEHRTGTRLGYDHAAPAWQRVEAYLRWVDYLEERGISTNGLIDESNESGEDDNEEASEQPMVKEASG
jgi:hypothetical protein